MGGWVDVHWERVLWIEEKLDCGRLWCLEEGEEELAGLVGDKDLGGWVGGWVVIGK